MTTRIIKAKIAKTINLTLPRKYRSFKKKTKIVCQISMTFLKIKLRLSQNATIKSNPKMIVKVKKMQMRTLSHRVTKLRRNLHMNKEFKMSLKGLR